MGSGVVPTKSDEATPTMVKSTLLIRRGEPIAGGDEPNQVRQRLLLITATRSRSGTASSLGWKNRPAIGSRPSSVKKFAETTAPLISFTLPLALAKSGAVG